MFSHKPLSLTLLSFLLLAAFPILAVEYTGRVVGISDGDTLTLLTPEKRQIRVRLGEIDTPESRQPYGTRARQALSDLAFGKEARVVVQDTGKYGRTVGRVYIGNVDVNADMVRQGAAWVYRSMRRMPACTGWKPRPRPPSGACGDCRRRSEYHLGNGAMAGLVAPLPALLPPWCRRRRVRQGSRAEASAIAGK